MTGFLEGVLCCPDIELGICFPRVGTAGVSEGQADGFCFYSFGPVIKAPEKYDSAVEEQMKEIIRRFDPDILHVFGTEFAHSLAAVRAFARPLATVINIQGLVSIYARHFMGDVPGWVQRGFTLRDLLRWDNLSIQQKKFVKRGEFEKEALRLSGNVIGRTDWDRACSKQMNPDIRYFFLNETLRDSFYMGKWEIESCDPHRIFVSLSQASFPIKGLHYVLEAVRMLAEEFHDIHLYVAGNDITRGFSATFQDRLKLSIYGKYIIKTIEEYGLRSRVTFLGFCNEQQMKEQYVSCRVFVSPSTIENESNSVSEAKILGVPVVASFVGGVTGRISHGEDGFLYQHDAPYMLAYYVRKLFMEDELAGMLSENARQNAQRLHDREKNRQRALEIYEQIFEQTGKGGTHEPKTI
ncbi:MAG: glycosyltransferase [Lachnospiraceae bacterium]|nr:glycosyltransferase [Lachnospiraceae bacterium]